MDAIRQDDSGGSDLREMMEAWNAALGKNAYTLSDVVQRLELRREGDYGPMDEYLYPDLREIVFRLFGGPRGVNTRNFADWLLAKERQPVGKFRFKRSATLAHGNVRKWFIEVVER